MLLTLRPLDQSESITRLRYRSPPNSKKTTIESYILIFRRRRIIINYDYLYEKDRERSRKNERGRERTREVEKERERSRRVNLKNH